MKSAIALAALLLSAVPAVAQTVTIYEPVTLPYEYTEDGLIKAQHIKPGDVTPEEYQRLLDEADKVRTFQMNTVTQPTVSYTSEEPTGLSIGTDTSTSVFQQTAEAPSTLSGSAGSTHTVVKGDTLYNISKRYNVGVSQIQDANDLSSNGISLGQTLRIPSTWTTVTTPAVGEQPSALNTQADVVLATSPTPSTGAKPYAVVPGDTLYSISKRACVGVDALKAANGIGGNAIQPGQKLALPGGHCLR